MYIFLRFAILIITSILAGLFGISLYIIVQGEPNIMTFVGLGFSTVGFLYGLLLVFEG